MQHSGKEDNCKYCLTKASKMIGLFFGFINLVFTKWKTKCMFWKFDPYVPMACEEPWPSFPRRSTALLCYGN